jgi:peptide/nickel transport system permease protein
VSRGRRILVAFVTLVAVSLIGFLVVELAPGDPAAMMVGLHGAETARQAVAEALGLHGGLVERAVRWLLDLVRLDLGRSFVDGRAVRDKIFERLPTTCMLALFALALAWGAALPAALWRARRGGRSPLDPLIAAAYALPVPALALACLAAGAPYGASLGAELVAAACLLPLLLPRVYAHISRALDDALAGDELRTLRAVGASRARVIRVALRGKVLRLLTLLSVQLPALLSGAVLVEAVFGVPGLGLLAVDALAARDYPVQLGLLVVGSAITIGSTLLVDLVAPLLDPRLAPGPRRGRA